MNGKKIQECVHNNENLNITAESTFKEKEGIEAFSNEWMETKANCH